MQTIHTLLVGLEVTPKGDGLTDGSGKALDQAIWLAQAAGARLHLVHSTWNEGTAPGGARLADGQCPPGLTAAVARCEDLGIEVTLTLSPSRPWYALILAALKGQGQMVLVGKRDSGTAEGRRLGSVTVKLLRKCPVPVWAVRPEHDLGHKLILAATDLTPVGDRAVELAAWIAEGQGARLRVVHALGPLPAPAPGEPERSEEELEAESDAEKARVQAHVDAIISNSPFDGESTVHLSRSVPHLAIREAGEHLHPDLLVMGSLSTGGRAGFLVGSTAERLLDRIDCSVLTLKPDNFVCPLSI